MISVECREFGVDGIADLSEAIELAKKQGISNARGAIHEDILWNLYSLGAMAGLGMVQEIPGIILCAQTAGGLGAYVVDTARAPGPAKKLIKDAEKAVIEVAGESLPEWRPSSKIPGVRLVTMQPDSTFYPHTDDYEGLVISLQWGIEGTKIMHTEIGGDWMSEPIERGDITFFAGDTFSKQSRRPHGFSFSGTYAAAFTLGQDPYYTISGRYPLIEATPELFPDFQR